jgi:HTH-type transcriptional regulator/antitoxin HigA
MGHLKIIKDERAHQASLDALVRLLEADPAKGTAEADEIDVRSLLIQKYEDEHFPLELPDPLEAIRFRMQQQGLTRKDLVPMMGSASKVSEVLSGKRPLSLSMIRRLHDGLGISAEVLIRESGAELPADCPVEWERFPLAEMAQRRYFPGFTGGLAKARKQAEKLVGGLLSKAGLADEALAFCRSSAHQRTSKAMDDYALLAWQARVLARAAAQRCAGEYRRGSVDIVFLRAVARLSWSEQGPSLVPEFLSRHGIVFVTEPHLPKTYLDGAAMVDAEGRPVVALTLRHDRIDNFWFTLLHELAHVALHLDGGAKAYFDDLDGSAAGDDVESEADSLAEEALIPEKAWRAAAARQSYLKADVLALARELDIHPSIIAGRIRHETGDFRKLARSFLNNGVVRQQLGVDNAA